MEYCLPPDLWESHRYSAQDLQLITRMVFQCYPIEEVNAARVALGLSAMAETVVTPLEETVSKTGPTKISHDELKNALCKIGRIQGYIPDEEYRLGSTYLDVVWRRVERSVPTFVFEVQVAGDIYHAMAKLKHAFDLWNSRIFLVASLSDKRKFEELVSGTFHEIQNKIRFIDLEIVKQLLLKKLAYKNMERNLGIFET